MGKDIKVKEKQKSGTIHIKESAPLKTAEYSIREVIYKKINAVKEQSRETDNENATYATDKVENAMHKAEYHAEQVAVKSKDYAVAKVKEQIREHNTDPVYSSSKTSEQADISQEINVLPKQRADTQIQSNNSPTKEPIFTDKLKREKQIKEFVKAKQEKVKADNAKETVSSAQKTVPISSGKVADTGQEAVNTIKAKESARIQQINDGTPLIKTKGNMSSPVQTRLKKTEINSIRLRSEVSETLLESIKAKNALQNKAVIRTKKSDVKNTVLKKKNKRFKFAKAAKEKAKKQAQKKAAQEAAKRTQQAAKVTAKTIKVIAEKVAQVVTDVVKAVVAAVSAFGGCAVVVILLIVIAIVGAIAASPFGIFFSDENAGTDTNSIPLSSIVAECNVELSSQLDSIEDNTPHDRVVMEGEQASWDEVIAIFAVKTAGTGDETAEDVVVIDEPKKQKLKSVFWNMNTISSSTETVTSGDTTETVLYITINAKTKDDMINEYHFTAKQQEALDTLLNNNDVIISATHSLAISDANAQDVLKNLSPTLPAKRKAVIKAACSLVGKVNYFWGGKSSAIGWDSNWGKMTLVTSEGSRSTGSMRPFGLDCSGFVTWSFINSGFTASRIGHGTQGQIAKCTRIPWSSAQPGDLVFISDLSHVGVIAGKDTNGNILVVHCASGANSVVITTNSIFDFAARPICYS